MLQVGLTYGLVKEVRKGEQAQCVPCGRCVKDNVLKMGVLWAFQELHYLANGDCLIYTGRQRVKQFTCSTVPHRSATQQR